MRVVVRRVTTWITIIAVVKWLRGWSCNVEISSSNLAVCRFPICVEITAGAVMTPEGGILTLDDMNAPIVSQSRPVISRYHPVSPDNLMFVTALGHVGLYTAV